MTANTDDAPLLCRIDAEWIESFLRNKLTIKDDSFTNSEIRARLIALADNHAATYNTATHKVVPIDAEVWTEEQREAVGRVLDGVTAQRRYGGGETMMELGNLYGRWADELARVLPKQEGK